MKVTVLSMEYPPNVYGGVGVHVGNMAAALSRHMEVEVRTKWFRGAARRPGVRLYKVAGVIGDFGPAVEALKLDLDMVSDPMDSDIVHSHTWYMNLAGALAKRLYGIPAVATVHSLEPLRPWKAEQLGRGYELSKWMEREGLCACDRIIAVSEGMKKDIMKCYPIPGSRISVVYNGIDPEVYRFRDSEDLRSSSPEFRSHQTSSEIREERGPASSRRPPSSRSLREVGGPPRPKRWPRPLHGKGAMRSLCEEGRALETYGIRPPYVLFVGRLTRQKGVFDLLEASRRFLPGTQLVLATGRPDEPGILDDLKKAVRGRDDVLWINRMLGQADTIALYSGASVAVTPSVYEPFGIVVVEAMACGAPVVASAVGGIREIVESGKSGLLVPPADPPALSEAINRLLSDQALADRLAWNARHRVEENFTWQAAARKTYDIYKRLAR